jgi:Family of unknown function (DUF6085)
MRPSCRECSEYSWYDHEPHLCARHLIETLENRIKELETALSQHGHIAEFRERDYGLEHPVECRKEGLLNCPVDKAIWNLGVAEPPQGRYSVSLDEDGALVIGPRAPDKVQA